MRLIEGFIMTVKHEKRKPAGFYPSIFQIFLSMLWGGNHTSIKVALDYSPPLQIGWMRFVSGGLVTVIYMCFRRESFLIKSAEVFPMTLIGILFSVQIVFMNYGQYLTTAGHATALNATFPIWAACLSHFLVPNDLMTRYKLLAIILSYLGVLSIVFLDTGLVTPGISLSGDLLSITSAALLGLRLVLTSNFAQNMSEVKLMLGQLIMGTIVFLIASQLIETTQFSYELNYWIAIFYQGSVIAGFGFLANAWLMKRYLPSTITFFSFIQPLSGVTVAWLILGENPGRGLIVGLILIVIGAIIFSGESYYRSTRIFK